MNNRSNINLNAYATFGENVGTGEDIFAGKCDINTMQFKTISAIGNLTIYSDSENLIISGTTGNTVLWGNILGTLSNQTDLQTAFSLKLDVSVFTGYTASTNTTLSNINSDITSLSAQTLTNTSLLNIVSGNTAVNAAGIAYLSGATNTNSGDIQTLITCTNNNALDIIALSAQTIFNLQPGTLNFSCACGTYLPYNNLSNAVSYFSGATFYNGDESPTGLTRINLNGILDVTELRISTGNTAPHTHHIGDIYWDNVDHTVAITQSTGVTLQVGQEVYVYVRNNTGNQIDNGQVVYINGSDGNRPTISLARASSIDENVVDSTIGLATEDIENGSYGFVTSFGLVRGLNTVAYSDGDPLYVSTTVSGGTTNIKPIYPDYALKIGIVAKSGNPNGSILVTPDNVTDSTGLTTTFNNGLVKSNNIVSLGGTLTGDTSINGNTNKFGFTNLSCMSAGGVFYPRAYNCVDISCSGLPPASGHTGGMIYVADAQIMAWSNGTNWLDFIDNNPI